MRSTHSILMLSIILLGAPLAIAQAQTSTPGAAQDAPSEPVGAYSSVQVLLTAANQAIAAGQPGLAYQRLSQAKVKIIDRWVQQTNGPQTYSAIDPVVQQINNARFYVSQNELATTQQIISQILASNTADLSD